MKKKLWQRICCIGIAVVVLCSMTTQIVSAGEYSYSLLGGRFVQGIGNVTCQNKVDGTAFPQLQAAVEAAIVDWDWHLSLLNEQYGVSWNMTSLSSTQDEAMIDFVAMTNADANAIASQCEGVPVMMAPSVVAFTTYWTNGEPMAEFSDNWTHCKIILMYQNMQNIYTTDTTLLINDYYTLQVIINHEIGHALGLDEYSGNNGVIMYPHYNWCTADVPTAADLNGIYAIYGAGE